MKNSPKFENSRLSKEEIIIKNFHAALRKENRNSAFWIQFTSHGSISIHSGEMFIYKASCVMLDSTSEGLFYDLADDYFYYKGQAPYFDCSGSYTEFELDEKHLKLVNKRLLETLKSAAISKTAQNFSF